MHQFDRCNKTQPKNAYESYHLQCIIETFRNSRTNKQKQPTIAAAIIVAVLSALVQYFI